MRKNKSLPKLYLDHPQVRKLPGNQQFRQLSQRKIKKYNPINDPQMLIYLGGKKKIKSKLQQMGYVLNPQNNQIISKNPIKNTKLPYICSKSRIIKTKMMLPILSKNQFDNYLCSIKKKLGIP